MKKITHELNCLTVHVYLLSTMPNHLKKMHSCTASIIHNLWVYLIYVPKLFSLSGYCTQCFWETLMERVSPCCPQGPLRCPWVLPGHSSFHKTLLWLYLKCRLWHFETSQCTKSRESFCVLCILNT